VPLSDAARGTTQYARRLRALQRVDLLIIDDSGIEALALLTLRILSSWAIAFQILVILYAPSFAKNVIRVCYCLNQVP